jgi:hypothetical protein
MIRAFYETSTEKIVDGRSASKIDGKLPWTTYVYPCPRATVRVRS